MATRIYTASAWCILCLALTENNLLFIVAQRYIVLQASKKRIYFKYTVAYK